jgi:hypothetical protein
MDVFGNVAAALILIALLFEYTRNSPKLWERLEAFYERLKYIIGSLFVRGE